MNCSKCGSVLPENANIRFCPECGSPLVPQIQIPQANAGAAVPQQAHSARGYSGNASGGFTPRAPGYEPPATPAQGDATMYGGSPSGGFAPRAPGYTPPAPPAQGDATMYGGNPSGGFAPVGPGYVPPGAGFTPRQGGPDDTVFLGANGGGAPLNEAPAEKAPGGSNKKFLAVVIPLIAVILASLAVIFIFVIYPELKDDTDETAADTAAATQEAEDAAEAPGSETAADGAEDTQTPSETVQDTTAETEPVTAAQLSSPGYNTGHYVNSTESRVHIRTTTSKSGKHVDYVLQDEYIDVSEVLDLGASADATVRWWGKVTKGGKSGWVSLYYLTCVDLLGTQLASAQIDQLWQSLQGYWNTLDKKRYSSFSTDNGSPYFVYSPWSGSAVISAHADAEGMGDLSGLVRLHLHEDAAGASGAVNAELYLDLSEMANGRIAWSFGTGWEDGYFAGTDQSKAKPKK